MFRASVNKLAPSVRQVRHMSKDSASAKGVTGKGSAKLWGGRFDKETMAEVSSWTAAIGVDSKMVLQDIWGSMAHVSMLGRQGVIPLQDATQIIGELKKYHDDFEAGKWQLTNEREDVHLNVEGRLIDNIGMEVGGKMHTTRSRNDQTPITSRMYFRDRMLTVRQRALDAANAFLQKAKENQDDVMVAYTHVQHAQPVSIAFWLSQYASQMTRDITRMKSAYDVVDMNVLGAGAIAGTSFNIDRKLTTKLLGFQTLHEHALDATGTRDFMLEILWSNATMGIHLSRLAEEVVLWSSYEFRTLILDDGFAMGSSMMPQKKNPGALELLRGRSGRLVGFLTGGFVMLKGLPSGYNRDFHEEKELCYRSLDLVDRALQIIPPLISTTKLNKPRMEELTYKNFSSATEIANYLVRKDVPFRKAHHIVGAIVGDLYRAGKNFKGEEDFIFNKIKEHGVEGIDKKEFSKVLDTKYVASTYNSEGGTGTKAVATTLANLEKKLAEQQAILDGDVARVGNAYAATKRIADEIGSVKTVDDLDKLIKKHTAKL